MAARVILGPWPGSNAVGHTPVRRSCAGFIVGCRSCRTPFWTNDTDQLRCLDCLAGDYAPVPALFDLEG
ncbi:hypothetical protein IU431_06750 [Nocardia otitidiscaviarum]|uniref:hypothetical protein n=1 Tax=Nocardia otitidiscaviarum TaxID=1823 RepID=UPI0004A6CA98|nr:hypothetical protein [Nocardia otitidiscaviarum]MBF6483856.1 hypothetical protein [Nocardia otitidiscaviarum]